jgi:DtxR family Mn-dependent transcriptional regulator
MKSKLSASTEDYLEAIYLISKDRKVVRVKDISATLGVSMPSVNQALNVLKEKNLIQHEKYGYIELTEPGKKRAGEIYSRHEVLFKFFKEILNVPSEIADRDACMMEHSISPESLEKLVSFVSENKK